MDFEQYLEKDIITFLDGKIFKKENVLIDREEEYGIYMARDYLKELSYALDNEELTKAKRLFDDLKAKFSMLPKNSLERKKVYALLEKMYDKIQNYVKIQEGKIEVIKQGDSEVFKDTTEKFTDISDKAITNKFEISPEVVKEFENEKNTELVIKADKHDSPKEQAKIENVSEKKEKHGIDGADDVSVESQIFGKHEKHDKELEEKDMGLKPKDRRDLENLSSMESALKNEMIHAGERLLSELHKKIEEKDIESIREEITKQIIQEIDKRFDAERHLRSGEREKLCKDILDQVYLKAKHVISEEDNKTNRITEHTSDTEHTAENISRRKDSKIKYIIEDKKIEDAKNSVMAIDVSEYLSAENMPAENINRHQDVIIKHVVDGASKNAVYRDISANDNENKQNKIVIRAYPGHGIENFEDDTTAGYEHFSRNIGDMQKSSFIHGHHDHNDENLRRMYEEAIHTMFQNDYTKAAKIFEKILRIRPENRAAKIRLYECIEAISNA